MTLVGAAAAADRPLEAAELAYHFIDGSYRSIDRREPDEHGGLPGVTREYRQTVTAGKWGEIDYVNAGIEGYGWGALSVHLLLRYLLGLREEAADKITLVPALPQALRRVGAVYRAESVQWGQYALSAECIVLDAKSYTIRLSCSRREKETMLEVLEGKEPTPATVHTCEWQGTWGEKRTLELPQLTT